MIECNWSLSTCGADCPRAQMFWEIGNYFRKITSFCIFLENVGGHPESPAEKVSLLRSFQWLATWLCEGWANMFRRKNGSLLLLLTHKSPSIPKIKPLWGSRQLSYGHLSPTLSSFIQSEVQAFQLSSFFTPLSCCGRLERGYRVGPEACNSLPDLQRMPSWRTLQHG